METSTVSLASLNPRILPSPCCVHCSPHGLHECNCRETGMYFVVKVFLCNKSSGVKNKEQKKIILWQVSHTVSSCFISGSLLRSLFCWTYLRQCPFVRCV